MNKIVENVTIDFKNGERECFNAILLRKKGVCTGNIVNNFDNEIKFIEQNYIPLNQIEKITFLLDNDELKTLDFK
jgi:hypothetical protein